MGTGGRLATNGLNHDERLAKLERALCGDRYREPLHVRIARLEDAERRRMLNDARARTAWWRRVWNLLRLKREVL